MTLQLTEIFFGIIPSQYLNLISPLSLIIAGFAINYMSKKNNRYVGRLTMFSNSMALVSFYLFIPNVPALLKLVINISVILGIIGLISYAGGKELTTEGYYKYTYWFNSIITGGLILIYYIFPTWFT